LGYAPIILCGGGFSQLIQANKAGFNPDSAVERELMSKEQNFRSEDNAFCL
jgi:hypothetical protein